MEEKKKKGSIAFLLEFAGARKALTLMGLALSSVSMLLGMAPYVCVWLSVRELLAAAPDFSRAAGGLYAQMWEDYTQAAEWKIKPRRGNRQSA